MECKQCEGKGKYFYAITDIQSPYIREENCRFCKGSGKMLDNKSNYPVGFNGVEGKEEESFIFYLNGEVDISHYTEDEAFEELKDMTLRELITKGLYVE